MIIRRVVTGHDENGKSVFLSDGPPPRAKRFAHTPGFESNPVWITGAKIGSARDCAVDPTAEAETLHAEPGGSVLLVVTFPPDTVMADPGFDMGAAWPEHLSELPGIAERFEPDSPGMHRTDTLDYAIVMSGEISLELDGGVQKHLVAGDIVVQQGTRHAWRNRSDTAATVAFCMLGRS